MISLTHVHGIIHNKEILWCTVFDKIFFKIINKYLTIFVHKYASNVKIEITKKNVLQSLGCIRYYKH